MSELERYESIAEALSLLLHPYAEVVIHELKSGRIKSIHNNFSNRKVGEKSLLGNLEDDLKEKDILKPYYKNNFNGAKIKSVSVVLRNEKNRPIGFFCINLDVSMWEVFQGFIQNFVGKLDKTSEVLFKDDWKDQINSFISNYLKKKSRRIDMLTKIEKKELILILKEKGAFKTKNAASYIGSCLNLSRATVYNYLKEK
ncbi:MAG: Transcriptional regulator DauR [Chlamydiia bacterium]|nr:Transcriptional regulator DauR [Chlamydiia bacterium]